MRNLVEYPITADEVDEVLNGYADIKITDGQGNDVTDVGSIDSIALSKAARFIKQRRAEFDQWSVEDGP